MDWTAYRPQIFEDLKPTVSTEDKNIIENISWFLYLGWFLPHFRQKTWSIWSLGGLVFQKVFQKLAPDIWIKYLGYITNIPEVKMDFEQV